MNALFPLKAKSIQKNAALISITVRSKQQMPLSAPTPCRDPSCPEVLATPGFCSKHKGTVHRDYGRARRLFDGEVSFYRSSAWRATRAAFLRDNPLCVRCKANGLFIQAMVVDHVLPLKDGGERFNRINLQSLCVSCHNRKTAIETHAKSFKPRRD